MFRKIASIFVLLVILAVLSTCFAGNAGAAQPSLQNSCYTSDGTNWTASDHSSSYTYLSKEECLVAYVVSQMDVAATDEPTATDVPTEEPTATEEPTEVPTDETPSPTVEPTETPAPTEPVVTPVPTEKIRIPKGRSCISVWEGQIVNTINKEVGYRYFDKRPSCQRWLWLEHAVDYDAYKLANPID